MGDIADDMIDGTLDCQTGEYIGRGHGYPRTQKRHKMPYVKDTVSERKIRKVRRELAVLIKTKHEEYPNANKNKLVDLCRKYINRKYGSGWRERGFISNDEDQWKENLNQYKAPEFNWELEINN